MQQLTRLMLCTALLGCLCSADAGAQNAGTVVANGLNGPMGVMVTPDGAVWVVDSGTGGDTEWDGMHPLSRQPITLNAGNTARILKIGKEGSVEVVAALPSIMVSKDLIGGGARLAMHGGSLYATSAEWSGENATERYPMAAAVVRIEDGEPKEVASTWDLEHAQNPDGLALESNPYGLAVGPDDKLWLTDAAGNTLLRLDPNTGSLEVVAVFDGLASPIPGPTRGGARQTDPVPTAVAFDEDGNTYVSLLPGFPILPDSAKVVRVTEDGQIQPYAHDLTMLVDLRRGPDGELYAVSFGEFGEQGPVPNSGALVRVREGADSEELLTGLSFPTSVDFSSSGDAYITLNGGGPPGAGEVRKFDAIAVKK